MDALRALGYPELAASDAYKVLMLCDAAFTRDSEVGKSAWFEHGMALWMKNPDLVRYDYSIRT